MTVHQHELMEHWPAMVRVCERTLGSWQDAEDCAASALLSAVQRGGLQDIDNGEAWMVAVARRRALDLLRGRGRDVRRLDQLVSQVAAATPDVAEHVVEHAEAQWLAEIARDRLPESTQCLLEALAEGLTLPEAAARLGITRRAAESHLHRARRALRAVWATTLAAGAVLAGAVRRGAPAAPPVALAALSLAWGALPLGVGAAPAAPSAVPRQQLQEVSADQHTAPAAAGAAPRTTQAAPEPPAPPTSTGPSRVPVQRPARPVVRAGAAALEVTVTEQEREGPSDPLGVVVHCLTEAEVSLAHVGC